MLKPAQDHNSGGRRGPPHLRLNAVLSSSAQPLQTLFAKSDDDVRSLTLERVVMTANFLYHLPFTDPHTDTKSFSLLSFQRDPTSDFSPLVSHPCRSG